MRVEIFPERARIFPGRRRRWYVRVIAANGETINVSEAFSKKGNAKRHAERFYGEAGEFLPGLPIFEVQK